MQSELPDSVDFLKSVEKNAGYAGNRPVSRFKRLAGLIRSDAGDVSIELKFSRKADIARLDGRVKAKLDLVCQRCMQPLEQPFDSEFHLALIASEDEIAMLPESLEPYIVTAGEQSLIDVIEDELILSLPLVPRHKADCTGSEPGREVTSKPDTYKPFADLKDLMNRGP